MGSMLTGHVRHLGGDHWELVVNLPRSVGGPGRRRTTRRITASGKKRATAALHAWVAVLEQHSCTDPDRITLGEILRRYLEAVGPTVRPKTLARYRELADRHITPELGEWLVVELKPADLTAFYLRKQESGRLDGAGGLSVQTARHLHALIRAALTWAEDDELVAVNPARRVKHPPKPRREQRPVWSDAQILRAIEEAHGLQVWVPAALAGWAGLRRGEMCALAWTSVDLEGAALTVRASVEQVGSELHFGEPKTSRSARVVPLPGQLVELLREHKARQDELRIAMGRRWNSRRLVCCRADGQPVKPDSLTSAWRQFVRQHRLTPAIELHGLRRSYLSNLHDDGAPDSLIMERAGHTDLRTTHGSYLFTFSETDRAFLRRHEQRIAAAQARSAENCQCDASAVVSLAARRERRRR